MAQQETSRSDLSGIFLGQHEPNPKGHVKVVTLGSGKQLYEFSEKDKNENNKRKQKKPVRKVVEE